MKKIFICVVLITSLIIALVGCGEAKDNNTDKSVIYASFYPIYELAKEVGGDKFDIRCFMPMDKDPHLWEPSPKDIRLLSSADLLIINGANMEKWADKVIDALPNLKILNLSEGIELITYKGAAAIGDFQYMAEANLKRNTRYEIEFGHTHEDIIRVAFFDNSAGLSDKELIEKGKKIMEKKAVLVKQKSETEIDSEKVYGIEMGHETGSIYYTLPNDGNWVFYADRLSEPILPYNLLNEEGDLIDLTVKLEGSTSTFEKVIYDPHSWLSLVNAKKYLNSMQDEFTRLMPEHQKYFRKNKLNIVDELTTLEYEYKSLFKNVRTKNFVVMHHAYAYLARDFGLKQFPLQALTSMEDPSLKTIQKAIDFCNYHKINTIFYEFGGKKQGAEMLASELKGKAVPLASMEFVSREQKKNNESYIDLMRMNIQNIYEALK